MEEKCNYPYFLRRVVIWKKVFFFSFVLKKYVNIVCDHLKGRLEISENQKEFLKIFPNMLSSCFD
jgi:hypothetical protein